MKLNTTLLLRFVGLIVFLGIYQMAISQRTITGTVTDAQSGETLIGANILVAGTNTGTISDYDGSYSLDVPIGATELIFSYTGYAEQTVVIADRVIIDIALTAGELLEEVVVIGYGTVKKEDATGSISSVSSQDFNQGAIASPDQLLAGKVPGVSISSNSGAPGEGSTIRIRGGSSLSATNDPLIVIDGIPLAPGGINGMRNPLNTINPADIETFTVLKDASATAIYGSRASNGVIIITTKKGSIDTPLKISYNGNVSIGNRVNELDVLNASEYATLLNEQFGDSNPGVIDLLGGANTDWQNEIYQTSFSHDHNLSFTGAVGFLPYRASLGYTDAKGILKTDKMKRTTASITLTPKFFDNYLQVKLNAKGVLTRNRFANRGAIWQAVAFDPTQPIYSGNDDFGGYTTWLQSNGDPIGIATDNPLASLYHLHDMSRPNRWIGNVELDYRFHFLHGLRANLNLGYDYTNADGTVWVPDFSALNYLDGGSKSDYSQQRKNRLLDFYLNYVEDLPFLNSKLDVMAGYSWQNFRDKSTNFASNIDESKIFTPRDTTDGELYLLSLFGRLNYNIADKYMLTFTLRRDGSSRFSEDTRWGLFPSAAFAWKISDELFLQNNNTLSTLKLRLGWGITGQQDVGGYYLYQARYLQSDDLAAYQFGNTFYNTLRPEGYDANIKWEETTTLNAGLDFGFIDDRIYGSVDVYQRETRDLLNFIPVPAGTNLTNAITTNVGDLKNKGVEIAVNVIPFQSEDFNLDLGVNAAYNKNEITRLTATDDPNYVGVFTGGISGGVGNTIQIHSVGFPANSFYVYEQVYDDAGRPIEGLWVDRNGDGALTPDDRYQYKSSSPDWLFGFSGGANYKNLDFSFGGRAAIGNYVYNNVESNHSDFGRLYNSAGYLNNISTTIYETGFDSPEYFSDHYVHNASGFRMDHITMGYTLNQLGASDIGMRVYATVQNAFVITKYEGLDPEVTGGIDNNIYPRPRTVVLGVNLDF